MILPEVFDDVQQFIDDNYEIEDAEGFGGCCEALCEAVTSVRMAVAECMPRDIESFIKYAREEDRPSKTVFVITTDGEENSSVEYDYKKIKAMTSERHSTSKQSVLQCAVSVKERL